MYFFAVMITGRDFCVPPEENNRPQVVDDGASACLSGNPCDHCHGDCDVRLCFTADGTA